MRQRNLACRIRVGQTLVFKGEAVGIVIRLDPDGSVDVLIGDNFATYCNRIWLEIENGVSTSKQLIRIENQVSMITTGF